jgi:hypothetical protein
MIIAFPLYLTKIGLGAPPGRLRPCDMQGSARKSDVTLIRPYAELYAIPN